MSHKTTHLFCSHCINPSNLSVVNPAIGSELQFVTRDGRLLCEICAEYLTPGFFPTREHFESEIEGYFSSRDRILFAYSGGLDSTVVLVRLVEECHKRGIQLETFTVETGVKGSAAMLNVSRIIEYLKIGNHRIIDIRDKLQGDSRVTTVTGDSLRTLDVYRVCLERNILPCGKLCNAIIDGIYIEVMSELGYSELFTGGDTPKKNAAGTYSLFWEKPSGICIVRGGYAFGLGKGQNARFIKERGIPWVHPRCGGYDTDCLVPGVFLANGCGGDPNMSLEAVIDRFPVILEYLAERIRFGVIDRKEGLSMLTCIEIASRASYSELQKILWLTL